MSVSTGIIISLLNQVDHVTQNFTFNGYSALVNHCNTQIHLAVVLYIAMLGLSVMNGWIELSVSYLTKHVLKMAIGFSLATHWGFFSLFVYNVLTNGPNELSVILTQSLGNGSVNEALQNVFDHGMQLGCTTWFSGSPMAASFYLYALLIWLATLLLTGIALLEFVVAKFGLVLILVLAPIFCLLLLWENTRSLFESWLKFALSFSLTPIFVTAALMLLLTLLQNALSTLQSAVAQDNYSLVHIAPYLLGAIVGIGLLLKTANIASGIGGGLAVNVMQVARTSGNLADRYSGARSVRQMLSERLQKTGKNLVGLAKMSSSNKYYGKR